MITKHDIKIFYKEAVIGINDLGYVQIKKKNLQKPFHVRTPYRYIKYMIYDRISTKYIDFGSSGDRVDKAFHIGVKLCPKRPLHVKLLRKLNQMCPILQP